MTQIALITDTHWGCRNDSPVFAEHISKNKRSHKKTPNFF